MSKPVNIVLEKYDNEELAEANELIGDLFINANIENKRLKAENAKLRELVKNMHGWLVVNYEKFYVIPLNGLNNIERDMRELGIEVADD